MLKIKIEKNFNKLFFDVLLNLKYVQQFFKTEFLLLIL